MANNLQNRAGGDEKKGNLSTFSGVFTPSVLTILGVILFLRLGYVVGNAGLGRALMMIGLANAISVLTSISLAAIATNLKVKGGGDYYLISRTLGVEFGGAIGIVLGYAIGHVASMHPNMVEVSVPLWAVALAIGFSAGVGIIFGIIPAFKAAILHPIDALRHE